MESHVMYAILERLQHLVQKAGDQEIDAAIAAMIFMDTELKQISFQEKLVVGQEIFRPFITFRSLLIKIFEIYRGWPEEFRLMHSVALYQEILQPNEEMMWRGCSNSGMLEELRNAHAWIKIGQLNHDSQAFDRSIHMLHTFQRTHTQTSRMFEQITSMYLLGTAYAESCCVEQLVNLKQALHYLSMAASELL